ncbi:uncharacterized protein [Parasteatoda tepidariorum]|uniref:uncharacterized protein n=1 Tax=Parasteatoda tepidariorum TaxID=114398 RepID=UPI001C71994E|nr:uncharacterized protein LOC107452946 [Parasteatoda tepidariorum]
MIAKIIFLSVLTTIVVCNPIERLGEEDDIPVYTEKVSPGKPTKPARVPRFESKKLSSSLKPASYHQSIVPKPENHRPEPVSVRPVQRVPNHLPNSVVENEYPRLKPKRDYRAPKQAYSAPPLGVQYDDEVPNEHGLVHDYAPRRHQSPSEYGTAAGNAPKLRYLPAPQRLEVAPATHNSEYDSAPYDESPQPYIFGYELKDESGATQSRKEQGDDYGNKRGSYGYTDGYGIYREVEYVADAHGFRAIVKTNEPGTENQNPADVEIHSEAAKY